MTAGSSGTITSLIADDHPAMVEALAQVLIRSGFTVVGRAYDGVSALERIVALRPRLAVIDVRMPRMNGFEVTRAATADVPETSIVLYTGFGDRAQLYEAVDAGARGFVLKDAPLDDLVRALQTVAGGGTWVDPALAGYLVSPAAADQLPNLSNREREILRLLADGLANDEIGRRLFISPETVRTHVRKAMDKLEADTRTQAVATALRQSLIA